MLQIDLNKKYSLVTFVGFNVLCWRPIERVLRSKVSRGYVKVGGLGKHCFLPNQNRTKLAEDWGFQNNALKKLLFSDFGWPEKPIKASSPLTSENNQPIKFVKENVSTNWITDISSVKTQKIWASDSRCQTATLVHTRHFYNIPYYNYPITLSQLLNSKCVQFSPFVRKEYRFKFWIWPFPLTNGSILQYIYCMILSKCC